MKNTLAPVAIFCFKRIDLLKNLLNSLKKNQLSKKTKVYFFADLNVNEKDKRNVNKVRLLIKNCNFFKKKIIFLRKKNFGLKKNISDGVNHVLSKHNNIIVLEDDLVVSRYFLETMNILLNKYKKIKSISTITGYSFPKDLINSAGINKSFFLLKRPSSWGWATWKNKWIDINRVKIGRKIDVTNYGNDLIIMKKKKERGILNSWAYDWTIKHIKDNKFCVYPKLSMVKNYGFDENATNNLLKNKNFFSRIKEFKFVNFTHQIENHKIRKLSKLNYDINPIMFVIKLIYFTLFYEKPKR